LLVELFDQFRWILQVTVEQDNAIAGGDLHAGKKRTLGSEVA